MSVMTCKIILMTSDTVATLNSITHCHHSSDSVLRIWYRCIFYSVCMICWNKSYIDQCLLDCVVTSVTSDMTRVSFPSLQVSIPCLVSVLCWLNLEGKNGWQAAGVLCYKSLREFNFINMKELRKHTHHFLLFQGDTAAVSGSWTCRKAGGGQESHKLLVCGQRILRAGTLMHYVGEEQVNISWAAVTPTAYMHPCMHTYTQWKHR